MGTAEMKETRTDRSDAPFLDRLRFYLMPVDGRYEDLLKGNWRLNVFRDFMAGLIVAMVAIPLAMGFAMASGLEPEQGIVGGAVAGLIGALFGGSKYQVYGPTAAFIPVIQAVLAERDYSFLILASIVSGVVLMGLGLARLGRMVALVPQSIVVGFTIGIAITIAMSQAGEVLGLTSKLGYRFLDKVQGIAQNLGEFSWFALAIGLGTFAITKTTLKISPFLPGPLIAVGLAMLAPMLPWADKGLVLVGDRYGKIPTDFLVLTLPATPQWNPAFLFDLSYAVLAIVFVAAVESLLCSRMADRLADNKGLPFNPNKELWGQGMVNVVVVLLNGFPHTGALARTATNIRLGAISPLAGICKFGLKLLMAAYLATHLENVPMACIGGILLYVAVGMVKPAEVREVARGSRFHFGLLVYTASMVVLTDFLIGVASAIVFYAVLQRFFERRGAMDVAPDAA